MGFWHSAIIANAGAPPPTVAPTVAPTSPPSPPFVPGPGPVPFAPGPTPGPVPVAFGAGGVETRTFTPDVFGTKEDSHGIENL
tara:strand:- start:34952 stop:35200 length:249 start_codon:yes stop_codon:yes gene_type:complete